MIGLVPDAPILTAEKFRVVIVENVLDVFGALVVVLMGGEKINDFLLRRFQVRGGAQNFIDKRGGMKKRKTLIFRSSVIPF
ncbi:MAG: hypothetical protein A4E54_00805 [Pelotomaculum sp. PtaB.Bin117]|nr:MAG: hypothetical protein A4E54_00805 [Pelotomaculum sp. PtaB.Bin117]